ncbi:gamma-tubulin complex component 3 homolog, partial [Saccoglossus kowalevskii]|uniref:Gamma-tubulin complex component 3 homolog n=1 Tax=Saccoglossus kowalevskii TaxID=10224 RepID=A0ABM0N0U7_SACKO
MSRNIYEDQGKMPNLLWKLVQNITKRKEDEIGPYFQHALRVVGSGLAPSIETDEFLVVEKIKKKLVRQRRTQDAAVFAELHRKLQSQGVLKNRWSILYLLYELSQDPTKVNRSTEGVALFGHGLPALAASTPHGATLLSVGSMSMSSGIGSGISSIFAPTPASLPSSYASTPGLLPASQLGSRFVNSLSSTSNKPAIRESRNNDNRRQLVPVGDENTSFEVSECVLIRDIINALQGFEGKFLVKDSSGQGFNLDPSIGILRPFRDMVKKLSTLGWLYMK